MSALFVKKGLESGLNFSNHTQNAHKMKENKAYCCWICAHEFNSFQDLSHHEKTVGHLLKQKDYIPEINTNKRSLPMPRIDVIDEHYVDFLEPIETKRSREEPNLPIIIPLESETTLIDLRLVFSSKLWEVYSELWTTASPSSRDPTTQLITKGKMPEIELPGCLSGPSVPTQDTQPTTNKKTPEIEPSDHLSGPLVPTDMPCDNRDDNRVISRQFLQEENASEHISGPPDPSPTQSNNCSKPTTDLQHANLTSGPLHPSIVLQQANLISGPSTSNEQANLISGPSDPIQITFNGKELISRPLAVNNHIDLL